MGDLDHASDPDLGLDAAPIADLHAQVEDLHDRAAFEAEVRRVHAEFDGLLDATACAMLVVAREGRFEPTEGLVPGREVAVEGVVESVRDLHTFAKRGGGRGSVLNVDVGTDELGTVRVVLWDDDAEAWAELRPGSRVRLTGGRVKEGRFGTEVHLGRGGRFERTGAGPPDAQDGKGSQATLPPLDTDPPGVTRGKDTIPGLEERTRDLVGVLRDREATRTFSRRDGATGFMATVTVAEADGAGGGDGGADAGPAREVTLWDDAVRAVQRVPLGARVALKGLVARGGELHSTEETEVVALDGTAGDGATTLDSFMDG